MSSVDLSHQGTVDRSFKTTEAFLHTLASRASIGILLSDPWGNCHFFNQRLCELSGLTMADAAGEGWAKAIHADDRKRVLDEWYETARHIRSFSSESRFIALMEPPVGFMEKGLLFARDHPRSPATFS